MENLQKIAAQIAEEILEQANLKAGEIFVVGCSSSEITGGVIGKASSLETAKAVFDGIYSVLKQKNIYLAAQCCESVAERRKAASLSERS